MNAKLCKVLRGEARARTEGMPECRYVEIRQALGPEKSSPGRTHVYGKGVDPLSTRGVYRQLKRDAA